MKVSTALRSARHRTLALVAASHLVVLMASAATAVADPIAPRTDALRGRFAFSLIGASLTDSEGLDNGVNCLKAGSSANVPGDGIPARAKLISATLYIGGSLLDDGIDVNAEAGVTEEVRIFDTPDLNYDNNPTDNDALRRAALAAADRQVSFHPPGSTTPITVNTGIENIAVDGFRQQEQTGNSHNVAFFISAFDVTTVMRNQGRGVLDGQYSVADVRADICFGLEATCGAGQPTCSDISALHTKGAASWALLLIFEDPELPLAAISVYQGAENFDAALKVALNLGEGSQIADPAAGKLAFYALEGDLKEGDPSSAPPCNADEYILVNGHENPGQAGTCLSDADNPIGNIFNSTINGIPATPDTGPCAKEHQCCRGPSVCGETGVDLDTFDISDGLSPGAEKIEIELGSGVDHVVLGLVVVSVSLFEPVLELDSRIEVAAATSDGLVQLEAPYDYRITLSNTGNSPASNVKVELSAPRYTEWVDVVSLPPGSVNGSKVTLGRNGTGLLLITEIKVDPGEVAEIRLRLKAGCGAAGRLLTADAEVTLPQGAGTAPKRFLLPAPELTARGPGLELCPDEDRFGPFASDISIGRRLRGGGGCSSTGAEQSDGEGPWWAAWAVLLGIALRQRRTVVTSALVGLLLVGLIGAGAVGCAKAYVDPAGQDATAEDRRITDLSQLGGEACEDSDMVRVVLADGGRFCIDRFEAAVDGGTLGSARQGDDDTDPVPDGSTAAVAIAGLGIAPATGITWYQAKSACLNAGKRLCSRKEWERACRGPAELIYPYGNDPSEDACNGFYNLALGNPQTTGALNTCGSAFGAYDLSGNVEEWVEDSVAADPSLTSKEHRFLRGGSFRSNRLGLACFGPEFHDRPNNADSDRGFRCCR